MVKESRYVEFGERVVVSDPCYDPGTWCTALIDGVLPGNYLAEVEYDESNRPKYLKVCHKDYENIEPIEKTDADIGVDSGQAGIFDMDYFNRMKSTEKSADDWYDLVCSKTSGSMKNPEYKSFMEWAIENKVDINNKEAKMAAEEEYWLKSEYRNMPSYLPTNPIANMDNKGFCTSTNYGDGSYDLFIGKNSDGKVVSFKIDYIGDYEEEE